MICQFAYFKNPIRLRVLDKGRKFLVFHGKPVYASRFRQKYEKSFLVLLRLNGVVGAGGRPFLLFGALDPPFNGKLVFAPLDG